MWPNVYVHVYDFTCSNVHHSVHGCLNFIFRNRYYTWRSLVHRTLFVFGGSTFPTLRPRKPPPSISERVPPRQWPYPSKPFITVRAVVFFFSPCICLPLTLMLRSLLSKWHFSRHIRQTCVRRECVCFLFYFLGGSPLLTNCSSRRYEWEQFRVIRHGRRRASALTLMGSVDSFTMKNSQFYYYRQICYYLIYSHI